MGLTTLIRICDYVIALPAVLFIRIVTALPERYAKSFGRSIGNLSRLMRIRYKVLDKNLQTAFPGLSDAERKKNIRQIYLNFSDFLSEWILLPKMLKNLDQHVTCPGIECLDEALRAGNGVLVCSAHFGHWEVLAATIARHTETPLTIIRKRWNNRHLDKWYTQMHDTLGFQEIVRSGSALKLFRSLKKNEIIAMLVDQSGRGEGIWLPFFGRPTSFHRGPGIIASMTGCTVITAFCFPQPGRKWEIHFSKIEAELTGDTESNTKQIMSEYAVQLENAIRRNPEWYFWFHRRWKTSIPEHVSRNWPPE